jgi:hypothetical protein
MRLRTIVLAGLGALLGLSSAAAAGAPDERDGQDDPPGFASGGADFFVWDEDPREADAWAAELRGAPRRRTHEIAR